LSDTYRIRIDYQLGGNPKVCVLSPALKKAIGAEKLPHVYEEDRLCLHYPKEKSWTPRLPIANFIVPWIAEWLYFYEIWISTGEWLGGGRPH
jgi:hypothetical protein